MPTQSSEQSEQKNRAQLIKTVEGMVIKAGIAPAKFIPVLIKDLRTNPDPPRALNNYHRFLISGFSDSLLHDFVNHNILQSIFLEIAGQSQYLADILVRNPELLRWLTAANELSKTKTNQDYFQETQQVIGPFERLETKLNALKRFQRREILRLGAREILSEAENHIITRELSALADTIIELVLQISIEEISRHTDLKINNTLAVIALGKLGGEELNFSSDIDLMFVYDEDGKIDPPVERMSTLHEYYVRLSEFIIRHLIEKTGEGYFYRVDMRLRPYGSSGMLSMSRESYRSYYEAHGEVWERQMLLKARVVAGNKLIGTQFLTDLRPFIFPKTILRSPVEEIASIKQKIEQHLTGEADIKLGAGGIRDIEFIVQALMLINAGKNSVLAHNNSLQALNALGTTGLLSSKEKTDLEEAYCFLRKVEHRLQLLHGLQTHSLPETNSELLSLARRMKYRSTKKLLEELNRHREKVRKIFYTVFYTQNDLRRSEDKDGSIGIRTNELMDLKRFRFKELETAHRNFNIISEVLTKFCDLKTLVPLLNALRKFRAPDWGLQNFSMLATSIPIQRTLFVTLLNPKLLEIFAFITSRSRRLTMLLAKEPLLFESLVSQPDELINGNMRWDFLLDSDSIRFKYFSQFTIILQNFFQSLSIRKTAHQLSDVAETILRRKSDEAYNLVFTEKEGFPIAIVAMGKFGGRELSLDSDLDLVFIYDKCDAIKKNLDFQSLAENFSRAVLKNMVSTDRKIYDVDVRLRPEGRNAPLASDIEYLHSYIQGRALLWEKQALLRARVVWGNEELIDKFNRLVQEVLYVDPLPEQWREEIQLMREKIKDERRSTKIKMFDLKTDQGGLIDVEFIVQSLQLIAGRKEIGVRTSNTFEAIDELGKNKVLGTSDAKILARNYKWLRNLELLINLNSEEKLFAWPQSEPLASVIAVGMGEDNKRDLGIQISQIRKQNRRIYSKIISQNIKK